MTNIISVKWSVDCESSFFAHYHTSQTNKSTWRNNIFTDMSSAALLQVQSKRNKNGILSSKSTRISDYYHTQNEWFLQLEQSNYRTEIEGSTRNLITEIKVGVSSHKFIS